MWPHLLAACIGVWVAAAPDALGFGRPAATSAWITGPLIASFATIAMWGATRPVRWLNVPLGVWLIIAPLILDHSPAAAASSVAAGALAAGLSAVRGRVRHLFGNGWTAAGKPPRKALWYAPPRPR